MSTTPFSTAMPESAMKPTAAEIETGMPRMASTIMPPTEAKGTFRKMSSAGREPAEGEEQHGHDEGQHRRDDDGEPPLGVHQGLVLPAPLEAVAARQLHLGAPPPSRPARPPCPGRRRGR